MSKPLQLGFNRRARRCVAIAGLCFGTLLPAQRELTFEALLQTTLTAANEQRFAEALRGFEELEKTFGREPEYLAPATRRVVLPLHAHAHMMQDEAEDAIPLLETFLASFEGRSPQESFVLFSLGQAHHTAGNWEEARETYSRFVAAYPDTPEASIAQLRFGETFLEEGRVEDALDALDNFYRSSAPYALRIQSRLRALQLSRDNTLWERAAQYVLETRWSIDSMPEIAVLAFASLEVGNFLMGEERFDDAVRAYSLVPGYQELVNEQSNRIASTEALIGRTSARSSGTGGVWMAYYRQLLNGMKELQAQLIEGPDYTGSWLLRYGQAFALAERPYEAWTLFRSVAEDSSLLRSVQRDGHYRWILAAQALKRWDEARTIAEEFMERYEEAPEAPLVLFLIAYSFQQDGRPLDAVEVLSDLLIKYPQHRLRGRWIFSRGFNRILAERYADARTDFAIYSREFPSGSQALNAQLWHALAWFFEKSYAPALKELEALQDVTPAEHYLRPEIAYRRAAVLYALKSFEPALQGVESYLGAYREDRNRSEAMVLKGDILMGLGRLEEAIEAFYAVTPEAGGLYPYAVFQIGKIHRALEDYGAMVSHFEGYLRSGDGGAVPQQTEALYLIGWAMQRLGREADVVPLYLEALDLHANDLEAREIYLILDALNGLHGKLRRLAISPSVGDASEAVFQRMPRFRDWISLKVLPLLDEGELTAYSRFRLYEIENLRRTAEGVDEAAMLLGNLESEVGIEQLDARGLLEVGKALQARAEPSARRYFEALLLRYPRSQERVSAWIGLAEGLRTEGELEAAAEWLALVSDHVMHPDAPEGLLAYAGLLLELGRYSEVQPVVDTLLRLRTARGRPHAEGLIILAQTEEAMGRPERAIPIYQRVFNVYRAYSDLVGEAYVASATLFESIGELASARDTWREVIFFDELTDDSLRARAEREYARLLELAPEVETAGVEVL